MQTRDKEKQSEGEGEEKRDLELENIVGNLLIAEYQVDKLRTKLADLVDGFRPEMRFNKASTQVFKHNNKWYKLSLRIDEPDINRAEKTTSSQDIPLREGQTLANTNSFVQEDGPGLNRFIEILTSLISPRLFPIFHILPITFTVSLTKSA